MLDFPKGLVLQQKFTNAVNKSSKYSTHYSHSQLIISIAC